MQMDHPYQPAPPPLHKFSNICNSLCCLFSDNPSDPSRLCKFLLTLIYISLLSFTFYNIGNAIMDAITEPRISPPNVRLDSASFTSLDDAIGTKASNLTANFDITFIVTNPNEKYNISYSTIVASLNNHKYDYGGDYGFHFNLFAFTRLSPFLQLNGSENTLRFQINVVDQFVDNNFIAARAQGSIDFGLKLYAIYGSAGYWSFMEFYCKHVIFVFKTNNATFASGTCL